VINKLSILTDQALTPFFFHQSEGRLAALTARSNKLAYHRSVYPVVKLMRFFGNVPVCNSKFQLLAAVQHLRRCFNLTGFAGVSRNRLRSLS
jgi:hypothetical protein